MKERDADRAESVRQIASILAAAYDTKLAKPAKLPSDFNFCAARVKPVHAARANAPPTLMRRTPSAAMSATLKPLSRTTRTLIGFGQTASTSALIAVGSWGPG